MYRSFTVSRVARGHLIYVSMSGEVRVVDENGVLKCTYEFGTKAFTTYHTDYKLGRTENDCVAFEHKDLGHIGSVCAQVNEVEIVDPFDECE